MVIRYILYTLRVIHYTISLHMSSLVLPMQLLVGETAVPCIHRLEQVSSEEMVGSLAENLMEALRKNQKVEEKVRPQAREVGWVEVHEKIKWE